MGVVAKLQARGDALRLSRRKLPRLRPLRLHQDFAPMLFMRPLLVTRLYPFRRHNRASLSDVPLMNGRLFTSNAPDDGMLLRVMLRVMSLIDNQFCRESKAFSWLPIDTLVDDNLTSIQLQKLERN